MTDFHKLFEKYNPMTGEITVIQPLSAALTDCKPHNWVFDEFNERCPLCEAVEADRNEIIAVLKAEMKRTSVGTFDAYSVLGKIVVYLTGENK